ncbi:MAG TPA: hypothetical protein VFG05_01650 [Methylocella sp.]|nr:hypothetical protein [Methylocella sp.]
MTSSILHLPPLRLRLTEAEFCGWLGQAAPGDIIEYHRGFLALDRMPAAQRLAERDRTELLKLARRALWAAEHDLVHLVQSRHGPDDYSYLAIARHRPKTPPVSLSALLNEEAA